MNWTRNSWKNFPIKQQPQYSNEDSNVIDDIKTNMSSFPGIV